MKSKPDTSFWDQRRGKIFSSKGGWKVGEAVYCHGYSMMDDLVGQVTYMQLYMLNATGTLPAKSLADWVEAAYICMSYPDSRIWCNQIGALSGSCGTTTVAATCAGTLAMDSYVYGAKTLVDGVGFIQRTLKEYEAGKAVVDIVNSSGRFRQGKPQIIGYSRPIANGDERIEALERTRTQLGFNIGKHLELAFQIEKHLLENFNERINLNGYISAFLSDQDLEAENIYRIFSTFVASGVTACFVDTKDKVPGSFLPQRCDDIEYQGTAPREVPDKS